MFHVYVLRSKKDGDLYMGFTQNLHQRIAAHTAGSVISTKGRRPLQLLFIETFANKYDALRRERYFKTNEGKKMLKRILHETLRDQKRLTQEDQQIKTELEIHQLRWKYAQEQAKELVKARGWNEKDDDFDIQVEQEAKRQWMEEVDREQFKSQLFSHNADEVAQ